jgi:hypothetical protein
MGGLRQQIGPGPSALFFTYFLWTLVLPHGYKPCMPQMKIAGPFNELELSDEFRLKPATFFHFCRSEACAPSPAPLLGKISERTLLHLQGPKLLEKLHP